MSKGGSGGISGYRYYFDLLMGFCRGPINRLVAIRVGDLEAWPAIESGTTTAGLAIFNPGVPTPAGGFGDTSGSDVTGNQQFGIIQPNLFGGDKGEGGIVGNAFMMMGGRDQVVSDAIKTAIATGNSSHTYIYSPSGGVGNDFDPNTGVLGDYTVERKADISDFRGVATLYYSGSVCSNNPYPKVWKVRLQRNTAGWDKNGCWYPAKCAIHLNVTLQSAIGPYGANIVAMNPIHMLYQVVTDRSWGRGLPRDQMDDAAWVYAANRLYDEGFGLCMKWSKDSGIDEFAQSVVDHIGAAMYVDRGTGLMTIRLIRNDYDPNTLPFFDYRSGLLKVNTVETGSATVVANEIVVKYHDPILDKDRQIRVQNLASIQSIGATITQTKSYLGIPHPDLARRVALRDLNTGSSGLKRFQVQLDRRGWKMQPGLVMRITAPDKGIINAVLRIITYDDGTATDGTIKIEAVQDVFGMPSTVYTSEPVATWLGPQSSVAPPVPRQLTYEASYYDMVRGLTPTQVNDVRPDEGGLITVASRPTPNTLSNVLVISPEGGAAALGPVGTFAPTGASVSFLDYYDTMLQLQGGTELNLIQPGSSALLGTEIVRVDAIEVTSGIVTIARGCADTIPQQHVAGTLIFFSDSIQSAHTTVYAAGESVGVQLLSRTSTSVLDPSAALVSTVTITGRWAKPYPMGDMRVNGIPAMVAAGTQVVGPAVFTWASRNKVIEADQLIEQGAGPVIAEAGTTYTVQVHDKATGTLLREHSGITVSTWTYTDAEADANADPAELDIVLFTSVAGVRSMAEYHIFITHLDVGGYGNDYGYFYGTLS